MKNGFSLLEVLVVITILLIVMGGSVMGYARINRQRQFQKDIAAFVDVLNTARQKTIARDMGNTSNCTSFEGYRVQVQAGTSTYRLYRLCTAVAVPVLATYQLQSSTIDGSTFTIDFEYPYGILKGAERIVTFRNSSINECAQIKITTAGIITEQSC